MSSNDIRIVLRLPDPRPVVRDLKRAAAHVDDVANPRRYTAVRSITDPQTVVRKALGEFERD